jgi:hypothetical protein
MPHASCLSESATLFQHFTNFHGAAHAGGFDMRHPPANDMGFAV